MAKFILWSLTGCYHRPEAAPWATTTGHAVQPSPPQRRVRGFAALALVLALWIKPFLGFARWRYGLVLLIGLRLDINFDIGRFLLVGW